MKDLLLAIDQGTTGTTVLILDSTLNVLARENHEFPQHYPKPGWVEHDPEEIWQSVLRAIEEALRAGSIDPSRIAGIGITNQRETTILWERQSGQTVYPAIVWQDRRTAPLCLKLKRKKGIENQIRAKTGLVLDPYFSATKIRWILDQQPALIAKALKGEILFGTIDSFLVYRLSGGIHVTDVSNASRTLLMNLKTLDWDPDLIKLFKIPATILPKICSSSEIYGCTKGIPALPDGIPICGLAGDQQAALFGQACFHPGEAKCTYGTGSFLVMNTGKKIVRSRFGLLTSVAWKLGNQISYCLEGSAFIAGAAVQWLRDGLGIIHKSGEIEKLAAAVPDSGGVTFVPAFVGLGAPYWRSESRGLISGLTRGSTKEHLARATLEGIAFLQYDIVQAMQKDLGRKLSLLKVDGGASANDLLMQFQSDLLNVRLSRPTILETTALGAAFLAGLAVSLWKDPEEIRSLWKEDRRFSPQMKRSEASGHIQRWHAVVSKA